MTQKHLTLLHKKYDRYFFTINTEQYDWIRNPFSAKCSTVRQRKNYLCLLEKTFLKYEMTEL